ncbi:MAG: hypothetical protein IT204_09165 [Fimbriimonadaceae bacterium]|nr:hypothetical protein [Fimbriimonadaceae bacterium]
MRLVVLLLLVHGAPAVGQWELAAGEATLTVGARAELTLRSPQGEVALHPVLQEGTGWTGPLPSTAAPTITTGGDRVVWQQTWPVSADRHFELQLETWPGLTACGVTSRLVVHTGPRAEYWYWQTDLTADHYGDPEQPQRPFDQTRWEVLPQQTWWWLPARSGGVLLWPTNLGGRAPGPGGAVYLQALPRSQLLAPGDGQVASFVLAPRATADGAAAVSAELVARQPTALDFAALAARPPLDYGAPAPAWLRQAGHYNLFYRNAAQWTSDTVQERLRGTPLIIGSTPDEAALARCRAAGVRLLHYVVYTCLLDTARQVAGGGRVYSEWSESVDCAERDLKDHPEWVCIDATGAPQADAWGQAHGHPGLLNTCLHQPGLREAAVRQVRILMQRGYDGVFIDLAGPVPECHGPRYAKHQHPHAESNTSAYERVLASIYAEVKAHGASRVVIQNTCTGTLGSHWATCDGQMLEAFPFAADSGELRASPGELRWWAAREAPAVAHGKAVLVLPYFGPAHGERLAANSRLAFAFAALAGYLWADDWGGDAAARQAAADLGAPRGPAVWQDWRASRSFSAGRVELDLAARPPSATLGRP